jgi:hypothetical protein
MAIILLFTRHDPKLSSTISVSAIGVALVCALTLLVKLHAAGPIRYETLWLAPVTWRLPSGTTWIRSASSC